MHSFCGGIACLFCGSRGNGKKHQDQKIGYQRRNFYFDFNLLPGGGLYCVANGSELNDLTHLAYYFIVIPVGAVVAFLHLLHGDLQRAFYSYVVSFSVVLILAFTFVLPTTDARNPVSRSMALIRKYDRPVAYFEWINSAYVFQYGKPIPKIANDLELGEFVRKNGKVLIISSKKAWENAHNPDFKIVFECKDLFENPTSVVLIN